MSVSEMLDRLRLHDVSTSEANRVALIETARPHSAMRAGVSGRIRLDGRFFRSGSQRLRLKGVTYGTFGNNSAGEPLPEPVVVSNDFGMMKAVGINALRIYVPPPQWVLDLADEHELLMLVDVPCPKHLDFLESRVTCREARRRLYEAVRSLQRRNCILGCSIGNEIPPDIVRWYGAQRVERFLRELTDEAHDADPGALVTYANYPPTEYLELPFLDFRLFNVYLHDVAVFRRYLLRLANQVVDKPLVLGELGMDTLRNGEEAQVNFLGGHLREAGLLGLGGAFVYSWTDDWFTHGYQIEDWAFGLTRRDRSVKKSYHLVREVFDEPLSKHLAWTPQVSVVVCSYNGAATLAQCLDSFKALAYPDYEVILVDDGSTDNTPAIAAQFPWVRTIRQENLGLSAARNAGLYAAKGEIIAYTDSDCFADPDWLTVLVRQLEISGAAAVGGPNLTPEDGWLAGCVACAPGQPTHVLETDEIAEHIPGCNMAFRKESLLSIGGFDVVFHRAGDDVDICWRLHEAGYRVTFSPGAFVWHHRRQNPRAYLRQQAGYGQAEAMLARKHPDRFNACGAGKWRGVLYGAGSSGISLGRPRVHSGAFGQGMFQTLYRPLAAHWTMLPSTLEWQVIALLILSAGILLPLATATGVTMILLTLVVTALQAIQAKPSPRHDGLLARLTIAGLCWLQPIVRSWARYRTGAGILLVPREPGDSETEHRLRPNRYITMQGVNRAELLRRAADEMRNRGLHPALDSGWSPWDIEVPCAPGLHVQIRSVQEFYGGNSAQIAVGFRLRRTWTLYLMCGMAIIAALGAWAAKLAHSSFGTMSGIVAAILLATLVLVVVRRGLMACELVVTAVHAAALALGMTPFEPEKGEAR